MKNYSLEPNNDNIRRCIIKNTIGRNEYIFNFVRLLDTIDRGCSIAIDSKWGTGKTFFVKQLKLILENRNDLNNGLEFKELYQVIPDDLKKEKKEYITLYYDAWMHDDDYDPILSIIYSVTQEKQTSFDLENSHEWDKLPDLVNEISKLTVDPVTIAGTSVLTELFKLIRGKSYTKKLEDKTKLRQAVNNFFERLLCRKKSKLIIFIDELDRCNPNFAIYLLEKIKHYFVHDRIIFIFSVNIEQLECTINKYYGKGFNGTRYLDKIFDLRMELPKIGVESYIKYKMDVKNNTYYSNLLLQKIVLRIFSVFDFTMREIDRYMTILDLASISCLEKLSDREIYFDNRKSLYVCAYLFVPIMIALKMTDIKEYNNFISGKNFNAIKEIIFESHIRISDVLGINNRENNEDDKVLLEKIYLAVMGRGESVNVYGSSIIDEDFSSELKNKIDKIMSLISVYNDYAVTNRNQ